MDVKKERLVVEQEVEEKKVKVCGKGMWSVKEEEMGLEVEEEKCGLQWKN